MGYPAWITFPDQTRPRRKIRGSWQGFYTYSLFTWWLHDMKMLSALQECSYGNSTWKCYPHYRAVHIVTSRHGNAIRITGVFTCWLHDMEMLSALQGVHMVTSWHGNAIRITGVFTCWLHDMEMLSALQGCSHADFTTWKCYPHYRSFVKSIPAKGQATKTLFFFFAASLNNFWTNSRVVDWLGRHGTCVTSL